MRAFYLGLSLLLVVLSSTPSQARIVYLQDGLSAFEQGDYQRAYQVFFPLAQSGHADGQFFLAMLFDKGKGVPKDKLAALQWYQRAAEQGHVNAQYFLGLKYRRGDGVRRDLPQAQLWYRKAAEQGDSSAQYAVAQNYELGRGVGKSVSEALIWYEQAAQQGHVGAQLRLGQLYFDGQQLARDERKAQTYWRLAAAQGSARAAQGLTKIATQQSASAATTEGAPSAGVDEAVLVQHSANAEQDSLIRSIQRRLIAWGYYTGAVDGRLDAETSTAIRAFQHADGVTPDGQPSAELLQRLREPPHRRETAPARTRYGAEPASSGSGFIVAGRYVLTNNHVVDGCASVGVKRQGLTLPGAVAAVNREDDMALLRFSRVIGEPAALREASPIRLGEKVFVVGYPLRGFLADDIVITSGEVNALAGPYNDRRYVQISAPVQNGNSGGPVIDASGKVIGMVVSSLNSIEVARQTGDIAQNVNFAIKTAVMKAFLAQIPMRYVAEPSTGRYGAEAIAQQARSYTVMVECYK